MLILQQFIISCTWATVTSIKVVASLYGNVKWCSYEQQGIVVKSEVGIVTLHWAQFKCRWNKFRFMMSLVKWFYHHIIWLISYKRTFYNWVQIMHLILLSFRQLMVWTSGRTLIANRGLSYQRNPINQDFWIKRRAEIQHTWSHPPFSTSHSFTSWHPLVPLNVNPGWQPHE